jgi:hypothetical protein
VICHFAKCNILCPTWVIKIIISILMEFLFGHPNQLYLTKKSNRSNQNIVSISRDHSPSYFSNVDQNLFLDSCLSDVIENKINFDCYGRTYNRYEMIIFMFRLSQHTLTSDGTETIAERQSKSLNVASVFTSRNKKRNTSRSVGSVVIIMHHNIMSQTGPYSSECSI